MAEPYQLDLSQAVADIRSKRLSALELLESCLKRIDATDERLHAWTFIDPEGARAKARLIDATGSHTGLLSGIPLGFKDLFDIEGMPTMAGFEPWRTKIAARDAEIVSQLRMHGAVILGKTVTTQFAFADPPETRNPWDTTRSASGSSSGTGAAVAARQVPAALGTQTTGSNLRPAAYNGVVGYKPSYGLFSTAGILPLGWSMDHPGLMARNVQDLALLVDALHKPPVASGGEAAGVYSRRARRAKAPRFGILPDFVRIALPEIRENILRVAHELERAGASVVEVRIPTSLDAIKATQWTLVLSEALELHRTLFAERPSDYAPRMRAMLEVAATLPAWAYLKAQRMRYRIRQEVEALWTDVDCLLSPVAPDLPALHSEGTTGDYSLLAAWSMLGLPAMSVPTGLSNGKLPMALQLACPFMQDEAVIEAAGFCENVLGRMPPPPI